MPYANIIASLADADFQDIYTHLNQTKAKLPFLINLSTKERKKLARQGPRIKGFNSKTLLYAETHPNLVPNYIDANATGADQELTDKLKAIKMQLDILSDALHSTILALQNEVYSSTRAIYHNIETASKQNVPGSSEIYQDLKQYFPSTGKKIKRKQS